MNYPNLAPNFPLIYPDISGTTQYTNILLIDNAVIDYRVFVDSVNDSTFPIVYSTNSTKSELIALLQANFTTIQRIGICFTSSSGGTRTFLDGGILFVDDESEPYSDNLQFILNIIHEFQVQNIDFLACDTLNYPSWTKYYDILKTNTGVTVGASSDKTGNIKYGGDWVLESTSQDVEFVYFSQSIEYYTYLLDNPSWATSAQGLNGCVAMDLSGVYFYVTNFNSPYNITKINATNPSDFSVFIGSPTQISYPYGIVYYKNYFYVCNTYNNIATSSTICKINAANPSATDTSYNWVNFGSKNTNNDPLHLSKPRGMTVYKDYLYICNSDTNYNSIIKINPNNPMDFSANWGNINSIGFTNPKGICAYNDNIYINNPTSIIKMNANDPSKYSIFVQSTQFPNSATTNLEQMIVYNNYLYITDNGNNRIIQISLYYPNLYYNSSWAISSQGLTGSQLMYAYNRYLYVCNYNNSTISQISLPFNDIIGNGTITGTGTIALT